MANNSPIIPKAFFSYVRHVDDHDAGRLTALRKRLEGEIRVQCGLQIEIFQDIKQLGWGDTWEKKIFDASAGSLFLIPVISPGYFVSAPCRDEFEAFMKINAKQPSSPGDGGAASGVILPIYYVPTDELDDPMWRDGNPWAQQIAACQWSDWRNLRLEPWESPAPHRQLESMAKAFKARLKAMGVLRPPSASLATPVPVVPGPKSSSDAEHTQSAVVIGGSVRDGLAQHTTSLDGGARNPAPMPRRRELIVDASGAGQFKTISDAVKAAGVDDIILVKPGHYAEGVHIERSVTILGDGPRDSIIVEGKDTSAILFTAPFGRIANLTIRQAAAEILNYAFDIAAGALELEGCDISSAGLTCIAVHDGADPTVRRNRIHDGKSSGVHVFDSGKGTFEDNDIFANALAGVAIKTSGDPVVRRNRIHDGMSAGVVVFDSGKGTFEDNDIFANALSGVAVTTSGDPHIVANRITRNGYEGVGIYDGGRGTFKNNILKGNARGPWNIAKDCLPNVVREGKIKEPARGKGR